MDKNPYKIARAGLLALVGGAPYAEQQQHVCMRCLGLFPLPRLRLLAASSARRPGGLSLWKLAGCRMRAPRPVASPPHARRGTREKKRRKRNKQRGADRAVQCKAGCKAGAEHGRAARHPTLPVVACAVARGQSGMSLAVWRPAARGPANVRARAPAMVLRSSFLLYLLVS